MTEVIHSQQADPPLPSVEVVVETSVKRTHDMFLANHELPCPDDPPRYTENDLAQDLWTIANCHIKANGSN